MFKKLLLLTLLSLNATLVNAVVVYPPQLSQLQVYSAPKMMAWDIHKVLAAKEGGKWTNIYTVIKAAPLAFARAFRDIAWAKITGRQNPTSRAKADINTMQADNKKLGVSDASGEAYVVIFEKHDLKDIANAVILVSNSYKPQPVMQEIVEAIAAKNIPQRFASNIGPRLLQELKLKFNKVYHSTLLDKILPGKVVDYSRYGKNPLTVLPPELASVGKPTAQFFREFMQTYNPDKKYIVIFADDSLANVQAAAQEGFVGIHFEADKPNAQAIAQLRDDLKEVGVLA